MSNNKHKLTSTKGLKSFLKEDIGATNDDIRRVSGVASKYTDKVPYGKDALNILDDMIDNKETQVMDRYSRATQNNYDRPEQTVNNNNRRRETYFDANRYKIKK